MFSNESLRPTFVLMQTCLSSLGSNWVASSSGLAQSEIMLQQVRLQFRSSPWSPSFFSGIDKNIPRAIYYNSHTPMSTYGSLFRVTTYGESHCASVGAVVDGCPPVCAISFTLPLTHLLRPTGLATVCCRHPSSTQSTKTRTEQPHNSCS